MFHLHCKAHLTQNELFEFEKDSSGTVAATSRDGQAIVIMSMRMYSHVCIHLGLLFHREWPRAILS